MDDHERERPGETFAPSFDLLQIAENGARFAPAADENRIEPLDERRLDKAASLMEDDSPAIFRDIVLRMEGDYVELRVILQAKLEEFGRVFPRADLHDASRFQDLQNWLDDRVPETAHENYPKPGSRDAPRLPDPVAAISMRRDALT